MGVTIVGAGLTGLSAAHHLGGGYEIREASDHVGGHASTTSENGFRWDRTGHLLHMRDEEVRAWVEELIGDDLISIKRRSRIWSHGRWTRYPYQSNTFGLPIHVALRCVLGFLRAKTKKTEVRTFEDFIYANFGAGFAKHFMIPYNEKLWGVHPREITADWCQRFVPIPKIRDVLAGAVGMNNRELGYNSSFFYPRNGIGSLANAMYGTLPDGEVHFNSRLFKVYWRQKRAEFSNGDFVSYDHLINTIPLDQLCWMLNPLPSFIEMAAMNLRCTKVWYVDVALSCPNQNENHWSYFPDPSLPFYRIGCYSHFSDRMAPPGKSNLYVEMAGRGMPDLDDLRDTLSTLLVDAGYTDDPNAIESMQVRKMDRAYVIYTPQHRVATEAIHKWLRQQGIISTGRYGKWVYSSMEDAIIDGREAAQEVLDATW